MSRPSAFRNDLFANRVVLITGATSEIGRHTAIELATLNASLALVDQDEQALLELRAGIEASTDGLGLLTIHACDIRHDGEIAELVEDILSRHGHIDGLVNDGGGFSRKSLLNIGNEGLDNAIRCTLTSGFSMMRELFVRWMADHGGAIVNLISDIWTPCAFSSHVGAASLMMQTLTESAAAEWSRAGVRVNCVAPSLIAGPGVALLPMPKATSHDVAAGERLACLSDIVSGIVWLLSPAAAPTTGSCLRIGSAQTPTAGTWAINRPQDIPTARSIH